jgi:fermentation-respiration switch protein FrsA (DUF1100 family)
MAGLLVAAGCTGKEPTMNTDTNDWMNSPDVLRVAFHPRKEQGGAEESGFRSLDIPVADGVTLGARFYAAGHHKPTILFFHGNGEIVADYADMAPFYTAMGVNFFPVDYRGYGRSSGQPTASSMLADAGTVFTFARTWLAAEGFAGPIVVMGRSMGSASALEIASAYPDDVAGLIIDSGFADVTALMIRLGARPPAAGIPESSGLRHIAKIAVYKGPVLIIHGVRDMIIPVADAEALFNASPSPAKRLLKIEGAGHNDLMAVGMRQYMKAIAGLVQSVSSPDDRHQRLDR